MQGDKVGSAMKGGLPISFAGTVSARDRQTSKKIAMVDDEMELLSRVATRIKTVLQAFASAGPRFWKRKSFGQSRWREQAAKGAWIGRRGVGLWWPFAQRPRVMRNSSSDGSACGVVVAACSGRRFWRKSRVMSNGIRVLAVGA